MRSFIYCRVSTKEQGTQDHYSLENQEQRCRDYIKMKKWQCFRARKDIASGKSDEREGFQDLLSAIKEGKVDVVIVYRLDRLSRNVRDIYDFLDRINDSGVAFVSVTEGFDTTTAMGRAMLGVAAVFAQLTREMISENTKDGLLRRAEAGNFNGNPGRLYGYDYNAADGSMPINEAESAVQHEIFDWLTEHKWGIQKIARMLNLQGVPTKTGQQWSTPTLRLMLCNPLLKGYVRVNDTWIKGRHQPIISEEQFDAAQQIMQGRKIYPSRSQQSQHLLSGLARCGICGRRLRAHYVKQRRVKGEGKSYVFYYHGITEHTGADDCKGFSKSATLLEQAVVDQIARISATGEMQKVILKDLQSRNNGQRTPMLKERDRLLLEQAQLGDKFGQWADRLDAGKIDEEQFERQNRRLLDRKKEIQQRLGELDQALSQDEGLEMTFAEVQRMLSDFPALWAALEHEERRETLRLLVEELKVYRSHAELKLLFLEPLTLPLTQRANG
jgi:site-specific DNA recombinase